MDEQIVRSLRGETTELEERQLRRWREASAENEALFRQAEAIWRLTGGGGPGAIDSKPPVAAGLRRRAEGRRARRRWARRARVPVAAAGAVAAGLALLFAVTGWPTGQRTARPDAQYAAGPGAPLTVALADGSVMRLAPRASASYVGTPSHREVSLSGRAFFAVAPGEAPFRVRVGDASAEALGTRFEVADGGDAVRVVVVEGRVRVHRAGAALEATRNQVVHLRESGAHRLESVSDALEWLDWPGGLLIFRETPLSRVAREVERRFGARVEIGDSALAERRVTAWFEDEGFGEVISAVCVVAGARCEASDSVATLRP